MKLLVLCAGVAVALGAPAAASAAVVNIGHELGFTYVPGGGSDPAPIPGQQIAFIGSPPTLDLAAGTYRVTNATGLAGANPDYTAWSYNTGTSSWAWAFVIATTGGTVVDYEEAAYGSSKAAVAALPAVQDFQSFFTLAADTTVAFTLRDYYVPDNAGGVALNVERFTRGPAVPEPASWALLIAGFALTGATLRRRSGGALGVRG
jgi:hypothetical protein